jgi:endoglucanase
MRRSRLPPHLTILLSVVQPLACLTPPALNDPGAVPAKRAAAAAPSLGDFSRTSPELLAKLRFGWNLGNSLDVPDGETRWGNPPATPELFAAVAKAGFKLVRIPVTWANHLGPAPGYAIDPVWLARVDEVVGFARSAGLYSIINLHHDGADGSKDVCWLSLKDGAGKTTDENNAKVRAQFVAVWTQIARYFANHGEELLFESMNEIHDGYGKPDPRHYGIVNELNQRFVTVIRASGHNNGKRHLIVPGYNTNIDQTIEGFKLPADSVKSRLVLSVHFYDPYLFTMMAKTHTWGHASPGKDSWGQEDFVVAQFDKLKSRYVDQGVPVLIGEYGAVHQDGYEDHRRYYVEYVTKAAVDRGLVPVYWDNGGRNSGADGFALIDREANGVLRPKLMEAVLRAATSSYSLGEVAPPAAAAAPAPAPAK